MSGPGPHVNDTELREATRTPHVNAGVPETCDPKPLAALIQAADQALWAAQKFIDGTLPYGALRNLVERYRTEAVRAGLAGPPARPRQAGCRRDQSRSLECDTVSEKSK